MTPEQEALVLITRALESLGKWARELGVFDLWLEIARERPAGD